MEESNFKTMLTLKKTSWVRSIYLLFVSAPLILLVQFNFTIPIDGNLNNILQSSFFYTLIKSIFYAFFVASISTVLGLIFSFSIYRIQKHTKANLHLITPILTLPFLLGESSISFLQYILLSNSSIIETAYDYGWVATYLVGSLGSVWQFSLFATYIFFFSTLKENHNQLSFFQVNSVGEYRLFNDYYLPKIKNTLSVTFVLFFLFSLHEYTKMYLLFKPSEGLSNELISHYFSRTYKSISILNPILANSQIIQKSVIVVTISIISCGLALLFFTSALRYSLSLLDKLFFNRNSQIHDSKLKLIYFTIFFLVIASFLYPFVIFLINVNFSPNTQSVLYLLTTIYPASLVSIILIIFSIILAALARIFWSKYTSKLDFKFVILLCITVASLAIPPIALTVITISLSTMGIFKLGMTELWGISMFFKFLPLMVAFFLCSFLLVKNDELTFTKIHKVPLLSTLTLLFGKRYITIYLLSLFLTLSLIINETTINNVYSEYVPAISGIFDRSLIGRSENLNLAISLQLFTVLLGSIIILIWNLILITILKEKNRC